MRNTISIWIAIFFLCQSGAFLFGQNLREDLERIFSRVLEIQLQGSPGEHGEHFKPANVQTNSRLINSLVNYVGSSVSGFPLSSTAAGITFDFSGGVPVSTTHSLGPIFSERAQTLGAGQINLGFNYSYHDLNELRGQPLDEVRFTFTHQDVKDPGLGDSPNEFDALDFFLRLNLDIHVLAFHFTVGITNKLDFSVALPLTYVRMRAAPVAQINSITYLLGDTANHNFGTDPGNPVLSSTLESVEQSATGIGDVALRLKYNWFRGNTLSTATLVEYRPPTGNKDNFLGLGKSIFKVTQVFSSRLGDFSPHLNVSYLSRRGELPNQMEMYLGYDQRIADWFTFVFDLNGLFQLDAYSNQFLFPQTVHVEGSFQRTAQQSIFLSQDIELTNIPSRSRDHILRAAIGMKLNPKEDLLLVANLMFPLNRQGLQSSVTPTVGFEFVF